MKKNTFELVHEQRNYAKSAKLRKCMETIIDEIHAHGNKELIRATNNLVFRTLYDSRTLKKANSFLNEILNEIKIRNHSELHEMISIIVNDIKNNIFEIK